MDEKDLNRELDEMLVMLKTLENRLISQTSGDIGGIRDLFAIHMAVLRSYYDMSEALEFICKMYIGGDEE
jgi:hypothetical protein